MESNKMPAATTLPAILGERQHKKKRIENRKKFASLQKLIKQ